MSRVAMSDGVATGAGAVGGAVITTTGGAVGGSGLRSAASSRGGHGAQADSSTAKSTAQALRRWLTSADMRYFDAKTGAGTVRQQLDAATVGRDILLHDGQADAAATRRV